MTATPTFAYRGGTVSQDYLGPVIVAKQGVPFDLTMVNRLGAHPLASAIDYDIRAPLPPTPPAHGSPSICMAGTPARATTATQPTRS